MSADYILRLKITERKCFHAGFHGVYDQLGAVSTNNNNSCIQKRYQRWKRHAHNLVIIKKSQRLGNRFLRTGLRDGYHGLEQKHP